MNPQIGYTVTEHGVTEQWSYADSDPDFCTITRLAAHYVSLLQQCMAAALVWSWKLPTLEGDGTELWQRRCWHLWFEAIGMQDGAGAGNSKRRRLNVEGGFLGSSKRSGKGGPGPESFGGG
jgi:hypothetical protein